MSRNFLETCLAADLRLAREARRKLKIDKAAWAQLPKFKDLALDSWFSFLASPVPHLGPWKKISARRCVNEDGIICKVASVSTPVQPAAHGREAVPDWLKQKTFCVEYNPNCPKAWLVRMCGRSAVIDKRPYFVFKGDVRVETTGDALGFGSTLAEAAQQALEAQKKLKATNKTNAQ